MASFTGPHQRVKERKGKKRKRFRNKDKSKERGRTRRTLSLHCCLLTTVVLLYIPGAASLTLEGRKGHNITLPCSCTTENVSIRLTSGPLNAYGVQPSEWYKGRVLRIHRCDLVLLNLKTTDAGKYMLHMYGSCDPKSLCYYIHVSVHLTGWIGKELMFDDLPRDAEAVEFTPERGVQGKEVWKRGKGVLDDRLTDINGRLVIRDFRASDAGVYRVLDAEGAVLNTVTVTESSKDSAGEHKDDPKTKSSTESSKDSAGKHKDDPKTTVEPLVIGLSVGGALAAVALAAYFIWKSKCQNKKADNRVYQHVPMQKMVQKAQNFQ